jgi:hypothetical protein
MKKITLIILFCSSILLMKSRAENPIFGEKQNQIMFNIGQGINRYWMIEPPMDFVPFNLLHFQYSQPMKFFRLHARKSLNIAHTLGWGEKFINPYTGRYWDWREMNRFLAFLSLDVPLVRSNRFYAGFGISTGVQHYPTQRINSMFLIGVKTFCGIKINDDWRLEFFLQHFSNARTERPNLSYNFWGIGFGRNF